MENEPEAVRLRIAGVVWMCALQFFIVQAIVQSAWTTPFSLATNVISDLGNTACGMYPDAGGRFVCSPWHTLMNISFSAQGIIILIGTVLARPLFRQPGIGLLVTILLLLTGVGMLAVGGFPENVHNEGHVIGAGVQFVTGNGSLLVIGVACTPGYLSGTWLKAFAMLGALGLVATGLFVLNYDLGLGVAGMERVAAYTFPVWLVAAGILLVTRRWRLPETTAIGDGI